jgi:hypothetical protein
MRYVNTRVQRHRDLLRRAGLRPNQTWVPDARRPDFEAECRRQSRLVALANQGDPDLHDLMDAELVDMESWSEKREAPLSPSRCKVTLVNPSQH